MNPIHVDYFLTLRLSGATQTKVSNRVVVDADASAEAQGAEAAVCRSVPASNAQWNIDQHINRLVTSGETSGAPNVVVLNTQGYNYGARALPQIQLEAALRRQR